MFRPPRYPFPGLLLFWFQRIAGFDSGRLDSHKAMERVLPVPLLMIAPEGDARIRPAVARQLFAESKASAKEIETFGKEVPHGAVARIHLAAYSALIENFRADANVGNVGVEPP